MFKIGDKVECVEGHILLISGRILIPKGFQGTVQGLKNCSGCGMQYIYVGFQRPAGINKLVCTNCKSPMDDVKLFSRCIRFRLLEENKAQSIAIELTQKEIIQTEIIAN